MPDDATYVALAVASRRALLAALRAAPGRLDVEALAAAVQLHPNTVRFHVGVLIEAGLVESTTTQRGARGRPRTTYAPTWWTESHASGDDDGYRRLAAVLAESMDGGPGGRDDAAVDAAGRSWARALVPSPSRPPLDGATASRRVTAMFAEMGFEPELHLGAPDGTAGAGEVDATGQVRLRACPFLELAARHPGVVCGLHLAMLRETLDLMTDGAVQADLRPFVEPRLCVVDLSPA